MKVVSVYQCILSQWLSIAGSAVVAAMACLGSVERVLAFTPNEAELEMADLVRSHLSQGRSSMVIDPMLSVSARAKAKDMGTRDYIAHTDLGGYGPNKTVQIAGYKLPEWWPHELDSNFIESLAFGYNSV